MEVGLSDEAELRAWAEAHATAGYHTAALGLAERVAAQSDLLTKRAGGAT
jgi:hypothetical protein